MRGIQPAALTAVAVLILGACGAEGDELDSATTTPQPSANAHADQRVISGADLDIATANCAAYDDAVYNTRTFHQRLSYGSVKGTIGDWMDMYAEARRGIEFSAIPSHPQLTQAFVAVADTYDAALEKLDHYTGSTDMSDEVMTWNEQDAEAAALCEQLPQVP